MTMQTNTVARTLNTSEARAAKEASATAIRPFKFQVSDLEIADLRSRILSTRFPEKETVTDRGQGVQLATIQRLAQYWGNEYDVRKLEAKINSVPNFITEIDGLDIHFMHVRSKHPGALPVIITHGWPGSVIEQMKLIGPLTDPTAFGGTAADAFDVVIPSMAGYGFSGKPTVAGWDAPRMARAWVELMKRLGYKKYVAQGGDWGALVTEQMALLGVPELIGIHVNMPGAVPAELDKAAQTGAPAPEGLSDEERAAFDRVAFTYQDVAYAFYLAKRSQTLMAISDSPVGLASLLIDHDELSYQMIARSFAGQNEGLTPDDVLDNVTLTWLTNTGVSSNRLYWENKLGFFNVKGVTIPVAVSAFPDELYCTPRSWAEAAFPNLIHYNKLPKGGHFAAWEQPMLLSEELRAGFKSLR